jgi:hypothetical protein
LDLASISPEAVFAQGMALTGSAFAIGVERKVLDQAQTDGANLVRLIDSAGGLGNNVNTHA